VSDRVFEVFLRVQLEEGMALASQSTILDLRPLHGDPPYSYLAGFNAPTLVHLTSGEVVTQQGFLFGVYFAPEHLRVVNPAQCLAVLAPTNIWHPNINPPFCCLGKIAPGAGLRELLLRIYEVAIFMRYTPREGDALNVKACKYVRQRAPFRPLSTLPLKTVARGEVHAHE
jgi:hypothetical protein